MSQMLHLGVVEVDSAELANLCRRYGVRELSLFGSAARGEMRAGSDVDLLVESAECGSGPDGACRVDAGPRTARSRVFGLTCSPISDFSTRRDDYTSVTLLRRPTTSLHLSGNWILQHSGNRS